MNQAAKRCVQWAVGLWILGAVVLIYGTQAYVALTEALGSGAEPGLDVLNVVLAIMRSALFPMGAVLIGAAVVIQTLDGGARPHYTGLDTARAAKDGQSH